MTAPSAPLRSGVAVLAGPRCLLAALRLLATRRELWLWCALPLLTNVLTLGLAGVVFFTWILDPLSETIRAWLAVSDPSSWLGWIWVGPLRALAWLVRGILTLLVALVLLFSFTLVGGVVASPFLDVLSRRVEGIRTGRVVELGEEGIGAALRGALRAVAEEAKRTLFILGVQLAILFTWLVPGLQPLSLAAGAFFAALFLPLDYTGYLLDRRGVRFRARVRWVWQRRTPMLGFGASALGTFVLPGLNFLCLPWLVSAGTLLALELPPPVNGEDR